MRPANSIWSWKFEDAVFPLTARHVTGPPI